MVCATIGRAQWHVRAGHTLALAAQRIAAFFTEATAILFKAITTAQAISIAEAITTALVSLQWL